VLPNYRLWDAPSPNRFIPWRQSLTPHHEANVPARLLLVTADDFGISPETSRGILDAARLGTVTSSVALVNSPFAASAIQEWEAAGRPFELGWHPCLTLDAPLLPASHVPSLVGSDGKFHQLGRFLRRIVLGRINAAEVRAEFQAQLNQFIELVGSPPRNVNAHHHIHVFSVVADALWSVLDDLVPKPFIRRVVENPSTLWSVPGARLKRIFLSVRGRSAALRQESRGFPGNQSLIGVTNPRYVSDPEFFNRWLASSCGDLVELACHPGYSDPLLANRDEDPFQRRPHELAWLLSPNFLAAVHEAGFRLVTAGEMMSESKNRSIPISRECPILSRRRKRLRIR
jgi:chitin disaccharide deacetylase